MKEEVLALWGGCDTKYKQLKELAESRFRAEGEEP